MMELKNCLHTRFFCFFMSFSYVLPHVLAFSRELLFFIYLPRLFIIFFSFYIYLRAIFAFIYLPYAFLFFIFYLLSPMRSLVLSSVREKGYLCFVCCFRVQLRLCFLLLLPFLFFYQSSVSAFSSFFLFSF